MKFHLRIIVAIVFFSSCESDGKTPINSQVNFSLNADWSDFPAKMSIGDSLTFLANLSVCIAEEADESVFIKTDSGMIVKSKFVAMYDKREESELGISKYMIDSNDSTSFESFLKSFHFVSDTIPKNLRIDLRATFKNDTIYFLSEASLDRRLEFILQYKLLKLQIQPDSDFYSPYIVPEIVLPKEKKDSFPISFNDY